MPGTIQIIALKIERAPKVGNQLRLVQVLGRADQAEENVIGHLVPLSGTCSEAGGAV
jgi:hypothetical protein